MPNKQVWTEEEYRSLKFLKQEKNIADWDAIALILNQNSKQARRSGKQCRYHYLTYARFSGEENNQNDIGDWTQKQNTMLFRLFSQFGCKWTYISYHFPNRSEGNIKNKFYSSLRRTARQMTQIEKKFYQSQKNSISYGMLLNVFDIANTLTGEHPELFEKIDEAFGLSQLRKSLLECLFSIYGFDQTQIFSMVKRIRKINGRSRSLGIFKIKNRKRWKLTQTGLNHLLGENQKQQPTTKIQQIVE